jgi:hypothetical protein
MNNRTYGILAGLIGSAVGAWWYSRYRQSSIDRIVRQRGTVIFDNTPTPTGLSNEGI